MTHTVTIGDYDSAGHYKIRWATVDITSYTSSGEAITASEFSLVAISEMQILTTEKGYLWWWDSDNSKIHVYNPTAAHTHTFTGTTVSSHTHSFTGSGLSTHTHTVLTINATETASDKTGFVSMTGGDGTTLSAYVGHAGGGTETVGVVSSAVSGGTPAGTVDAAGGLTPAGTNSTASAAAGSEVSASTDCGTARVKVYGH